MELTSPAFADGGKIPSKYTCDGTNTSPRLVISEVPSEAKSLVLIMDDPDVPKSIRKDGTWDHWIVFNIPATLRDISEGEEPPGTPGSGTSGNQDYFGPCPPDGEHRYFFKLYALDAELSLSKKATKQQVESAMEGHIIENTALMGRYERR